MFIATGTTNLPIVTRFDDLLVTQISSSTRSMAYSYDGLQRLLSATEGCTDGACPIPNTYGYTYDNAGNRLTATCTGSTSCPANTTRTYNAANQVSSAGFSYDAAGNLLGDGTSTYSYDALSRVTARSGTTFAYNGDGTLVSHVVSSVTTRYTQDIATPLSQILGDGTNTYVYGLDRLYGTTGTRTWYTNDALGSVRATLSDTGVVGGIANYDPYGQVQSGSVGSFGFTGELQQGSNVYLRARWYSAANGGFTARDPWSGDPQRPASLLPYLYTANSPINHLDPSGMDWLDDLQRGAQWVNDRVGFDAARESAAWFQRVGQNIRNHPELLRKLVNDPCVMDAFQTTLDLAGTLPILGVPIDLVNASISAQRGRYDEASMRLLFALPGLGDATFVSTATFRTLRDSQALRSPILAAVGGHPNIDDAIANAMKAIPLPGYYDVIAHAGPGAVVDLFGKSATVKELATFIRQQSDYIEGTPIRLLACNGGTCINGKSLAGELAKEMKAPVFGATSYVSVGDDRVVYLVLNAGWDQNNKYFAMLDPNGKWILFRP